MFTITPPPPSPSPPPSPPLPTDEFRHNSHRLILTVSRSISDMLMSKFVDSMELDFEYEQSCLWSPPVERTVFITSPGHIVFAGDDVVDKLKALARRRKGSSRRWFFWRRYIGCFFFFVRSEFRV